MKISIAFSGLAGLSAVIIAAASSHIGEDQLSLTQLGWIETALKYQMWHAIALMAVSCLFFQYNNTLLKIAGYFFMAGIVLFCGSLYLLAATEILQFGMLTPIGGGCFIIAWTLILVVGLALPLQNK